MLHLLSSLTTLEHHQVVADEVVLCVLAPHCICQALEVSFSRPAILQPKKPGRQRRSTEVCTGVCLFVKCGTQLPGSCHG